VLLCPEPACRREHPIVDGIPIVVPDVRAWAAHQLPSVLRRGDLAPATESLIGDAAGPGTALEAERANLSSYGHGHWLGGSVANVLETALALLEAPPRGLWLDAGCAAGRATVELARRSGELAVGVDLSFSMLRLAERVRREGRAAFGLRRVGLVYDPVEVDVPDVPDVAFWCADVGMLPFAEATFAGAASLSVLDSVPSPLAHLSELARALAPGAPAVLGCPYDWNPAATPVEQWIGGHSQRGGSGGSSAAELRRLLGAAGLELTAERDGVPWEVYANERSTVRYALDVVALRRPSAATPPAPRTAS
jgi:SAM-dependent methyltransferase